MKHYIKLILYKTNEKCKNEYLFQTFRNNLGRS